ncbi:aldo/keto reductase [Streptomyces sp. NPDC001792]|uniref:aldo/keto reductase n=1 Tax=Streptomyces sp. NPDC001792 TaxID=3154524 RepID=UPI003329556A
MRSALPPSTGTSPRSSNSWPPSPPCSPKQYGFAEQIGALKQLQDEGKVRHIGLSEVGVAEIETAAEVAPIAAVQNMYNLATRDHDPVIDYTAERCIAFVPFFPIALGGHAGPDSPLTAVAKAVGVTPAQTARAWLLHRAPNMVPIPGTSPPDHLKENLHAADITLSEGQFRRIDEEGRGAAYGSQGGMTNPSTSA